MIHQKVQIFTWIYAAQSQKQVSPLKTVHSLWLPFITKKDNQISPVQKAANWELTREVTNNDLCANQMFTLTLVECSFSLHTSCFSVFLPLQQNPQVSFTENWITRHRSLQITEEKSSSERNSLGDSKIQAKIIFRGPPVLTFEETCKSLLLTLQNVVRHCCLSSKMLYSGDKMTG